MSRVLGETKISISYLKLWAYFIRTKKFVNSFLHWSIIHFYNNNAAENANYKWKKSISYKSWGIARSWGCIFYSYHFGHLFIYNVACDQFIHREKFIDSVWSSIVHLQKIYYIILAYLDLLTFSILSLFLSLSSNIA